MNRLKKAVYDTTDPKLTPVFEEVRVPEGTGRLLLMALLYLTDHRQMRNQAVEDRLEALR